VSTSGATRDARLALLLVSPALAVVAGLALLPIAATLWEALHQHDLRLPWLGSPFIGAANFIEAVSDPRAGGALLRTVLFAAVTVPFELTLGLALALVMHAAVRARPLARVVTLLPWAIPTVVAALIWRFIFESDGNATSIDWFARPLAAWLPIAIADVWKTTPFVALLVLSGLQSIDPALHEAARMDGAGPWRRFRQVTLPLLRPALLVALIFRTLDAFRVFDLVYVMTGGGPGTSTEPLGLYTFATLFQNLRFGAGSALGVMIFILTFSLALLYVRALGGNLNRGPE
jgi:ABC-type sugar transport system permease subunit